MNNNITLHGSAIAIGKEAIIISGPSGSGKSDLALQLIDRGAQLIADDLIAITGDLNNPIASQTDHHIASLEIRGLGIIAMETINNIPLKLIVKLSDTYQRAPDPLPIEQYGPYMLPCLKIAPFEVSAAIKIEIALKNIKHLTNINNAN